VGLVDSGTTFTYLPSDLFVSIGTYFNYFCSQDIKYCKGAIIQQNDSLCFAYDQTNFKKGPFDYFISYPIIKLKLVAQGGKLVDFDWYPSEYLYRASKSSYCFAAISRMDNEIMIGGTLMR